MLKAAADQGHSRVPVNVTLFKKLDELGADAGDALSRERQDCPYARLDWFRLLERHCPPPGRFLGLKASDGHDTAWLLLARTGAAARAYAAWYSLRVGVVGSDAAHLIEAFGRSLRRLGIAQLSLAPMEDPHPLAAGLRQAGWIVHMQPATANWQAHTRGLSFEAYWAARPGKLRSTAQRRTKSAGLTIRILNRFDEGAWADYEHIYQASWKPDEGSPALLRALAEQEGAAGTLRLGIASKDGKPVAAQLWTVENGQATIHKLAYDESAKALSPGTVLGAAMFRHVIDQDRVDLIDYGTGDEPYKADWMDERRTLWRLTAFQPRSVRGLLALARAGGGALVRRLRKR